MPVWLVTGASGFLGRHLISLLNTEQRPNIRIIQAGRTRPEICASHEFAYADLTQAASTRSLIDKFDPDLIFHLAGKTPPGTADEYYRANTLGTALLLDALRERGRPVRVIHAGSAAELGIVPESDLPVAEAYPCYPTNAYGLSKLLGTQAGLAALPPVDVISARVFNPIGPGIPETQAIGSFANRLADARTNRLVVGDLDVRRDFIDIRDVARALVALADQGRRGLVYHVGTGASHRIREGLETLIALCGRTVEVVSNSGAISGPRLSDSRADISQLTEHTGWRPEIPWEQSLSDLWEDALAQRRLPLTA